MGLRGMQIEENAKRLSENLSGMRKQLDTFGEYFEKIGTHLKNAQQSYTEADKRFDKASTPSITCLAAATPRSLLSKTPRTPWRCRPPPPKNQADFLASGGGSARVSWVSSRAGCAASPLLSRLSRVLEALSKRLSASV